MERGRKPSVNRRQKAPCKGERDTAAKRCILVRYGYVAEGDAAVRAKIRTGLPKSIEELFGKRSDNVANLAFAQRKRHKAKVCRDEVR